MLAPLGGKNRVIEHPHRTGLGQVTFFPHWPMPGAALQPFN